MRKRPIVQCRIMPLCLLIVLCTATTQAQTLVNQRHVTGVNISAQINNYLEHLPAGYDLPANANKKYPLILYWKGLFDYGVTEIIVKGIPQKIQSGVFPASVTHNGVQYSFIVLTPNYIGGGCGAWDVDAMINYAIANYRVDRNRIYMTGISKGASLCYEYVNADLNFAKKIAAIAPLAPCTGLSWQGGTHAVLEQIRVWGLHNPNDVTCHPAATTGSVANINLQNPNPPVLAAYTLTPTTWSPDPHDIFWIPYEPGYNTPESGDKNMYDWFIQYSQNIVLPVSLKDFTARLSSGKVKLDWTTASENNSSSFAVERAGKDMKFTEIARVPAAGYSSGDKKYQLVDAAPLNDMSFYRIVQTDRDGKTQYFEIRRVFNGKQNASIVISPNPVRNNITAFVSVSQPQKISVALLDMQGRILSQSQAHYQEGLQEITLNAVHLAPGNYLLQLKGITVNAIEKLTKQ
ncbi:MAG TPA: T9SS type A sorting domain-containing protein [Chitinophagaceae bacterium]|nr:T9SS type A sorting domain-containing protein [Chitinophagaceae bacterium]